MLKISFHLQALLIPVLIYSLACGPGLGGKKMTDPAPAGFDP